MFKFAQACLLKTKSNLVVPDLLFLTQVNPFHGLFIRFLIFLETEALRFEKHGLLER